MRFWITKNSGLPIREQLVNQVVLGILSNDLPPGYKLPSVRAVARRHRIHANTVSAAWHQLRDNGWLELRRGSGLYVCGLHLPANDDLDGLVARLLHAARSRGYEPEEVLTRLSRLVHPRKYERVVIIEPDPAMRGILTAELKEHVSVPIEAVEPEGATANIETATTLVVALGTRLRKWRRNLPGDADCFPLVVRSAGSSLERQSKPGPDAIISIASQSREIRFWTRAMLIAAGIPAESICEVDSAQAGWRERVTLSSIVVTDVVTGRALPAGCPAKVYRVVADSCAEKLRLLCS